MLGPSTLVPVILRCSPTTLGTMWRTLRRTKTCKYSFEYQCTMSNANTFRRVWIEIYKSDRVVDISLTQWLALTPAPIVADVLKIPESVVKNLKKEKQLIIA